MVYVLSKTGKEWNLSAVVLLEFNKWLAEICFCDSYEILDIKELNDDESLRFLLKMNADLSEPFAQAILAANGWA